MISYCHGLVAQVAATTAELTKLDPTDAIDIETYILARRRTIAYLPLVAFMQYAHSIDIPDECYYHPAVQELAMLACDIITIQNDIFSFPKEQLRNEAETNVITLYRRQGCSMQGAFNEAGELLRERHRRWYMALADIPSWGEALDVQMQSFIRGIRNGMKANALWQ